LQEPVAGPEGGERVVAGEKKFKGPENPVNRVKRKTPNDGFGQGVWFVTGCMGKFLKREIPIL